MKPYPAYKDSGLSWLGSIPPHWTVLPLKYFLGINRETLPENTPADYAIEYLDISNVGSTGIIGPAERMIFKDAPSRARRIVKPGDTVISTVRTYLKAIAHIDDCSNNFVASTGFAVLTPGKDVLPRYVAYVVHGYAFINQVTAESKGVNYPAITSVELGNIKITTVTDLSEQAAIVAYLDRKTYDIERFIAKKRQLIALLNEQKATIINQAVTKGLNPDVPMKASGTMFIGEVPKHWEVQRGKYYFREVDERSEAGAEELLSVSHITGVTPRSEKNVTMFVAESYEGSKTCQQGDIVINTMWAWMGALGISSYSGIVSSSYGIYRQRHPKAFLPDYLDHLLRAKAYIAEYTCRSTGIHDSRLRMYPDDFLDTRIVHPPVDEQQKILTRIQAEAQKADQIIAKTKREIELIQEYRTTLISEAVTGKIDVREAAKRLTT